MYRSLDVRKLIRHYNELRASMYYLEKFTDIQCILVDFDNAVNTFLTKREKAVIKVVLEYEEAEAAEILGISLNTIKFHLAKISNKILSYMDKEPNDEILHSRNNHRDVFKRVSKYDN